MLLVVKIHKNNHSFRDMKRFKSPKIRGLPTARPATIGHSTQPRRYFDFKKQSENVEVFIEFVNKTMYMHRLHKKLFDLGINSTSIYKSEVDNIQTIDRAKEIVYNFMDTEFGIKCEMKTHNPDSHNPVTGIICKFSVTQKRKEAKICDKLKQSLGWK